LDCRAEKASPRRILKIEGEGILEKRGGVQKGRKRGKERFLKGSGAADRAAL